MDASLHAGIRPLNSSVPASYTAHFPLTRSHHPGHPKTMIAPATVGPAHARKAPS